LDIPQTLAAQATEPRTLGLMHFLAQTDAVGGTLLAVLLLMSVITWALFINKVIAQWRTASRSRRFLSAFAQAGEDLNQVNAAIDNGEPFSRLTRRTLDAARLAAAQSPALRDELLTRSIRRAIAEESHRCESGLTVLASIGSTAPFIGLFGTVWGVYHALINIGLSGQGTLDKVAGPVGEALIMTALGLAVAIPAVLGYNYLIRRNRTQLASLDSHAHDLQLMILTGRSLRAVA